MASIKDLLELDVAGMTKADEKMLRAAVQQMSDAANKRLRRTAAAEPGSQAIIAWQKQGKGFFSPKGKDFNQLRSEFKRVSEFLQAKTSTIKGSRAVTKETMDRLARETGVKMNRQQAQEFGRALDKVKETTALSDNPGSAQYAGKIKKWVAEYVQQGAGEDEIPSLVDARLDEEAFASEFDDGWGL